MAIPLSSSNSVKLVEDVSSVFPAGVNFSNTFYTLFWSLKLSDIFVAVDQYTDAIAKSAEPSKTELLKQELRDAEIRVRNTKKRFEEEAKSWFPGTPHALLVAILTFNRRRK